ncbi:MAG: bifunctional 2-polyprenyl-6-hydroxyphenol methylase/3-demethylubiquinol 3-O-methyltransferase UbiG [Pseudomonadota bacterium]
MNTATRDRPPSVNGAEIERYNRLAQTWWDADGPMWPLHRLNALRVPFVNEAVIRHFERKASELPLAGLSVLDIGCGAGLLSEAMARAGASVTGVDPAEKNIAIASTHAAKQGMDIEYIHGTIGNVDGRCFDVVLNMEVVEHVENLPAFMYACCQRVSRGGLQVVATLNRNPKSWLVAIVGAEYVLRWLPRGTHQWRKFVKPAELATMLNNADLRVTATAGVGINPLTRAYRITSDTSVNYMLVAAKRT